MPMTVIVTRDVSERIRGFLASVMPEPAPGVYTSGDLSRGVRERVWSVLGDWHGHGSGGSVVMVWRDDSAPGGLGSRPSAPHPGTSPISTESSSRRGDPTRPAF